MLNRLIDQIDEAYKSGDTVFINSIVEILIDYLKFTVDIETKRKEVLKRFLDKFRELVLYQLELQNEINMDYVAAVKINKIFDGQDAYDTTEDKLNALVTVLKKMDWFDDFHNRNKNAEGDKYISMLFRLAQAFVKIHLCEQNVIHITGTDNVLSMSTKLERSLDKFEDSIKTLNAMITDCPDKPDEEKVRELIEGVEQIFQYKKMCNKNYDMLRFVIKEHNNDN